MEKNNLQNFKKGWFVGNFEPSLFNTNQFEVAVKHYKAGDTDEKHYHAIAIEYTVVVSGTVSINGETFGPNDIITINRNEPSEFKAMTDATIVAVKTASFKDDKYLV